MRHNLKEYLISNYGKVYSLISNQFIAVQKSEGSYFTVHLNYRDPDGIPSQLYTSVHRLVICSHRHVVIPNGMVIDHWDMNRQNNRVDNFDIVTPAENSRHAVVTLREWRKKLQKLDNKDEEPERRQLNMKKEIWKPINYQVERDETVLRVPEHYHVSNYGRIKNSRTKKILVTSVNFNGYRHYTLAGVNLSVHRLVAMTFLTNPDPVTRTVVDHKDSKRQNNQVSNLQWVTPQFNVEKAKGVQVAAFLVDTKGDHGEQLIFPSIDKACQHPFGQPKGKISSTTMRNYLNSGKVLYGHIFRRIGSATEDEAAGPGYDLQNRGMFVDSVDIWRQEFEREDEEIRKILKLVTMVLTVLVVAVLQLLLLLPI